MQVLFEMMVQIAHKRGIGVETPSPRSFSGGHTKGLLVCTLTNTQTKKKDSNTREGKKRDREDVFGGRSSEIGSGWWSGLHLQVLEACLPGSVHTCLDTSNNGMFQLQRNRDNQPNARTRAHVRVETFLPRAHLFICLV